MLHAFTRTPTPVLIWAAYILTRPLGATLGERLTKPAAEGGLHLGRFASTLVIAAAMVLILALTHRRSRQDGA